MLLPAWFWIRRSRWKGALGSLAVLAGTLGIYAGIKHYFGAEYFAPLFFTDWVSAFFERGLFGGIRYTVGKLYYMGTDFLNHTRRGFQTGLASGAFFGGFLVCMAVLAGQSLRDWLKIRTAARKNSGEAAAKGKFFPIELHLAFSFFAMLFALLLMYKLTEGSKHLLTFMAAAVFVIPLMETRFYKKAVLGGVTFAYFYTYMAADPYDYQVPFIQEERRAELEEWQKIMGERLVLEEEGTPNYENVVIWVFGDTVEGLSVNTKWQLLYGLPEGFGISCCMPDYVAERFDSLESRYLFVTAGGEIDEMCREAGYPELGRQGDSVLYERTSGENVSR